MPNIRNAFTVDVEDYFQVSAFERQIDRGQWHRFESRVEANTRRILQLLDDAGVRATFFVLGWVAERFPRLIREIWRGGHEIGSHGYWHRLIYEQSPDAFRQDLCRSREVLQDVIGERITAYRAPSFSITRRSLWALEILVEEGFEQDSSVFPIYHDRYGIPTAEPRLHRIATPAGPLWEFPPAVIRRLGWNVPVSGGGYFRLFPGVWTRAWLRSVNRLAKQPFVFYIHPWELDAEQPRLAAGSWLDRRRHYLSLGRTERKLARLLADFDFAPMRDVIEQRAASESLAAAPGPCAAMVS